MPKDAKRNVDRYKIRGGDLNEFEFHKNQGQVKESGEPRREVVAKKTANPIRGATAKNLAAKKAAKK